ncbi:hypothetical protein DC522_10600 [Microvirga sp. KLBC 81]|uniref:hypothetical protein n=1 Tax=Microvirga sp. KLBC 81 TaxID=1862707 RepID=UPI000D51611C|nr:hypothetical protein [Microvirga sp. KLBC 81]PVE24520.1 hypothetical protein DC522_10600 [Microvirga sp. KLBC 81]
MSNTNRTIAQQVESHDGRFRLSIFKRSDGLFEFSAEELIEDDEEPFIPFWVQQCASGLHDTVAGAESEARAVLSWLRAQTEAEQVRK